MTPHLCAGMAGLRSARPSMLHWASAIHLDPSYNSGEDTTCSQFGSAQGVEHPKQWSYMEYHGHACVKIAEHKNSNGSRGLGDLKANTELSRHRGKVTDMAAPNETQPPITAGSQLTRWSIYPPAKLKESERINVQFMFEVFRSHLPFVFLVCFSLFSNFSITSIHQQLVIFASARIASCPQLPAGRLLPAAAVRQQQPQGTKRSQGLEDPRNQLLQRGRRVDRVDFQV